MDLRVREMRLDEVDLRIRYFHDASDEDLGRLGVDRDRLPSPDAWRAQYVEDAARPHDERHAWSVVWERDGAVVGFSSLDRITVGHEGFLHLHLLDPDDRQRGLGRRFIRLTATRYVREFRLRRVVSEPNAFNVAPNRALQGAGFRYQLTHECRPGPINTVQAVTRWAIDAADLDR